MGERRHYHGPQVKREEIIWEGRLGSTSVGVMPRKANHLSVVGSNVCAIMLRLNMDLKPWAKRTS